MAAHPGGHRVLVVGGGLMGCGIAAGFMTHGAEAVVLVREAARCESVRNATLALLEEPIRTMRGKALSVQVVSQFSGWSALTLVIESVKEDLAVKRQVFAWLDAQVPPGVPVGSNSSAFPISRIADGLATRARMFGMHHFMPAHIVPLVEVVMGVDSDARMAAAVCAMFTAFGRKPVLVKRDLPGFLANRIQHALMREVLSLIDSGIASAEDIDVAVRCSFGFRYAAIGPVMQKEISGWDSTANAAREIYPSLSNATVPAACLERLIESGKFGMKSGEGFFRWTPESAQTVRASYEERLVAALRLLD